MWGSVLSVLVNESDGQWEDKLFPNLVVRAGAFSQGLSGVIRSVCWKCLGQREKRPRWSFQIIWSLRLVIRHTEHLLWGCTTGGFYLIHQHQRSGSFLISIIVIMVLHKPHWVCWNFQYISEEIFLPNWNCQLIVCFPSSVTARLDTDSISIDPT